MKVYAVLEKEEIELSAGALCDSKEKAKIICTKTNGMMRHPVIKEFTVDESLANEVLHVGIDYRKYNYIKERLFTTYEELFQYGNMENVSWSLPFRLNCFTSVGEIFEFDESKYKVDYEQKKIFITLDEMHEFQEEWLGEKLTDNYTIFKELNIKFLVTGPDNQLWEVVC